jgi:predicted GNAT superfamily acetyltransferase
VEREIRVRAAEPADYDRIIAVVDDWWGRPVHHILARLLYERFFQLAAAGGRSVVCAVTAPVNSPSIAFHAALGFSVTGPVPGYDGPSDRKMVFERRLP